MMKDCDKIRPLLSEYVDGVLDDDRAWNVKMHLASCSVCSEVANDFSRTARLLASLPRTEPSASFEAMLAKRLADEVLKPKRSSVVDVWKERWLEWWRMPGVRPAFATGAALAALLPMTLLMVHPTPTRVVAKATPGASATLTSESDTLNELWQEHDAFASSVALGDRAAALATTADATPSM